MRVNYFINKPITKEEKIIMNEFSSNIHQTENVLYRMSSLVLVLSVMCHDISLTWRGRGRA